MAKVLETVQRLRKVEEATSQREEPAPVYLLDEIVELSKLSAENAQAICEHVVKRLAHKSALVKFKALRLVKHMCLKGSAQFQRCMQRQSQAIRELVHYKGEPDPLKGDAPNAHVRELAKETVETLFNASATASGSHHQTSQMQGRIQGFGSASSAAPPGAAAPPSMSSYSSSSSSGSRMVGFGSNSYGTLGGSAVPPSPSAAEQLSSAISPAVNNVIGGVSSMLKSAHSSMTRGTGQHSTRMFDSPPRNTSPSPPPGASHWGGGAAAAAASAYAAPSITAAQVMGSEEQLVDDICAPGGMRAAPLPEDLERFVGSVGSMDGLRVGELLREKMEASSWQAVLRALCALEAVVLRGSSQACGEVAIMFQSDPTPLHAAVSHPQAPVREAAARVIKLLLNEDVAVAAAPPKKQVPKPYRAAGGGGGGGARLAVPQVAQPDLLGLDNSPTAGQRPAAGTPDLLGGLTSSPSPTPPAAPAPAPAAAPQADSLFAGLDTAQPAAAPDAMFGGLTISSPSAAPHQAHPAAAAPPPPSEPLDLLFAEIPAQPVPQAYPQPASQNLLGTSPAPDLLGGAVPAAPTMDLLGMPLTAPPAPLGAPSPGMQLPAGYGAMPASQPMGAYPPQQAAYALAQQAALQQQQLLLGLGQAGWQAPAGGMPGAAPGYPQQQLAGLQGGYPSVGMVAPGAGMPGVQQQAVNAAAAAAALQNQMFGMQGAVAAMHHAQGGRPQGVVMRQGSWQGRDEVSNLMRHVASGGKHDPAFDFVKDELKPHK